MVRFQFKLNLLLLLFFTVYTLDASAHYDIKAGAYYNSVKSASYGIYVTLEAKDKKLIESIDVCIESQNTQMTCIKLRPAQVEIFKDKIAEMRDKYLEWMETAKEHNTKNVKIPFETGCLCYLFWGTDGRIDAYISPDFKVDSAGNTYLHFTNLIVNPTPFGSNSNLLNWYFKTEEDFNNLIEALDLNHILDLLNQESLFNGSPSYRYTEETTFGPSGTTRKRLNKMVKGSQRRSKDAIKKTSRL